MNSTMSIFKNMSRFVTTKNLHQLANYHNCRVINSPSFNYEMTKNKTVKEKIEKEKDDYHKSIYMYDVYVNLQKENEYYTNMALKHAVKN